MRLILLALVAFCVTGCAGMKLGGGYKFDSREFFLTIEKPLDSGLKK